LFSQYQTRPMARGSHISANNPFGSINCFAPVPLLKSEAYWDWFAISGDPIIKEVILTCLYLSENYDAGDPAAWGTFVLSPVTCLQQGLVIVRRYITVSIPACRFPDSTWVWWFQSYLMPFMPGVGPSMALWCHTSLATIVQTQQMFADGISVELVATSAYRRYLQHIGE
jgi:hypothetical protein